MKKFFIFLFISLVFFPSLVLAMVATDSSEVKKSTDSSSVEKKSIEKLKENIANKVEEIRRKNNRAVSGYIKEIKDKTIFLQNSKNYQVKIQDSDLTTFYKISGNQQKEIEEKDLKTGDYIVVSGLIEGEIVTANSIFKDEEYLLINGKINEINKNNYYLKVITSDKVSYLINIEVYTKQYLLNIKNLDLERIGFSKLKEGDFTHIVIKLTEKNEKNEYSAERVLIIPQEYFLK